MADEVKLTQQYEQKFGTLSTRRGKDEKKKNLFSWEPIPDCTDERCPIRKKCEFVKRGNKCQVVAGIVKSAALNILNNYGTQLNNALRNRIGLHLMPLYVQLARQYVAEAALTASTFNDNKGNPKVNPVYKEIRETLRTIDLQWKNLGLIDMRVDAQTTGSYYSQMVKASNKSIEESRPKIRVVSKKEA